MKPSWTFALLTTTLSMLLGAAAAPAGAMVDPQPVKPFVPGINEDPDLAAAWQQWQSKDIDDYVVTVKLSCFCPPFAPVRTIIRDDATRRVSQDGKRLGQGRGYSMDELFIMIREAIAEADHVTVDYTSRGIPKSIAIDPEEMAADEETYYAVTVSRLS